jgi:hypothetical protein
MQDDLVSNLRSKVKISQYLRFPILVASSKVRHVICNVIFN